MLLIVTTLIAAHIGTAAPKGKPKFGWQDAVTVIELVHPAPSSSSGDFDPFTLDRPTFRRLWRL